MKKSLIAFLMLATTSYTLAVSTPITKITRIITYPKVTVLAVSNEAGSACTNNDFIVINTVATGGKALYSAALTAFTTGSNVRFGVDGCYAWGGTIPITYRIELLK